MRLQSTEHRSVSSTAYVRIIGLADCELGRDYVVRLRGQNVDYRVICGGSAGDEVVSQSSIPAGAARTVRAPALPVGVWGGTRLVVEARLSSGSTAVEVQAEVSWAPLFPGEEERSPRNIGERGR